MYKKFLFSKLMRLRTHQDYHSLMKKSLKFVGRWIIMDIRVTGAPFSRLGIKVTKKYGSACKRNRFKRLVREAFRLSVSQPLSTFDVIARPRSHAVQAKMGDIQEEMIYFFNLLNEKI